MQTSTDRSNERRKSASPRIPVDLLVELCAVDERARAPRSDRMLDSWGDVSDAFSDSYEADGLDLSASGLRMRSAVLPDVGQRLMCRFDLPEQDAQCEAEGEVVWSNDAGRHGEFGLRFDALSPSVETALARWAMDRGPTTLPGEDDASAARAPSDARSRRSFARVRLDGVASAIEAEVSLRDELRLEVEQALPFLEIGRIASVEADGMIERRRLEHVSLRIENGVPRLVLGLVAEVSSAGSLEAASAYEASAHDRTAMPAATMAADQTMQDEVLDEVLSRAASRASASSEDAAIEARGEAERASSESGAWVTDGAPISDELEAEAIAVAKPRSSKRDLFGASDDSLEDEDPRAQVRRRKKLDEVRRVLLDGEELPEAPSTAGAVEAPALPRALESLKARARSVGAAALPAMVRLTAALRTGWTAFVAGAGPRVKNGYAALAAWIARVTTALRESIGERAPKLAALLARGPAKEKRRSTSTPPVPQAREATPRRTTRGPQPSAVVEETPSRPRVQLRYVLIGVVALLAVGSLAYALGSGPAEPAPIELPSALAPTEPSAQATPVETTPAPVEAEAAPPTAPTAGEGTPSPAAAAPTPSDEAAPRGEPSALSAPSTDEGRLPMPGYPSIGRASATPTSPAAATATATSPAAASASAALAPPAAPVVSRGRSFGADRVERGHTTTLNMSLPPTGLEGQADPSGFTVTVRGALSLDRAAAIARSNPAVDRASILNRGDHAVLDVRFVEGRSPAYRVELRDQQLDVTIGR